MAKLAESAAIEATGPRLILVRIADVAARHGDADGLEHMQDTNRSLMRRQHLRQTTVRLREPRRDPRRAASRHVHAATSSFHRGGRALPCGCACRPPGQTCLGCRTRHDTSRTMNGGEHRFARSLGVDTLNDDSIISHAASDEALLARKCRCRTLRTTQYFEPSCSSSQAKL